MQFWKPGGKFSAQRFNFLFVQRGSLDTYRAILFESCENFELKVRKKLMKNPKNPKKLWLFPWKCSSLFRQHQIRFFNNAERTKTFIPKGAKFEIISLKSFLTKIKLFRQTGFFRKKKSSLKKTFRFFRGSSFSQVLLFFIEAENSSILSWKK